MANKQVESSKPAYSKPDDLVVRRALDGEDSALAEIYDHHVTDIYHYIYSRVGNQADAEDLTAQTFMSVVEALPSYRPRGKFIAWIFQIARNKVMDYFREQKKTPMEIPVDFPSQMDTVNEIITRESYERLADVIQMLGVKERELIRLRFAAQLSLGEIGALVGRSEDTVRKSMKRLLQKLNRQMEVENE